MTAAGLEYAEQAKRVRTLGNLLRSTLVGLVSCIALLMILRDPVGIYERSLAYRRGKKRGLRIGITPSEREEYRERLKVLGLGLEDRLTARVGLLSGGQRQALTLLMARSKNRKSSFWTNIPPRSTPKRRQRSSK